MQWDDDENSPRGYLYIIILAMGSFNDTQFNMFRSLLLLACLHSFQYKFMTIYSLGIILACVWCFCVYWNVFFGVFVWKMADCLGISEIFGISTFCVLIFRLLIFNSCII